MNALNSLIIEGVIENFDEKQMFIKVDRYYKDSKGENVTITSRFMINDVSEVILKHCHIGQGIRIVGRLEQRPVGIVIVSEHEELKPFMAK